MRRKNQRHAKRLRLKLNSNDFSLWLENEMELPTLADRLTRIDIYTSTLNDIRRAILIHRERHRDDLNIMPHAVREERAVRPVDQAAGEDRALAGLEKTPAEFGA